MSKGDENKIAEKLTQMAKPTLEQGKADAKGLGKKTKNHNLGDISSSELINRHKMIERPPPGTKEEKKWIKAQRRTLRKELQAQGIKSRTDFETIARDLGLALDNGRLAGFLAWLAMIKSKLLTMLGLKSLLFAAVSLLAIIFLLSSITETAGAFTINMTADMFRNGFILSEDKNSEKQGARLSSKEIEKLTNITLQDIPENVDSIDGSHNGLNYMAYTFYISNTGSQPASYAYYLNLDDQIKNVASATWIMLFEEGKQLVYAKNSADGNPEELFGYKDPPFIDVAYAPKEQYYKENQEYGIRTTAFVDEKVVAQGLVENMEPGEKRKYTVVIWIEGYDPECTDAIFGGFAKFSMNFELVNQDNSGSIFNGIYRTDYDDYAEAYAPDNNKEGVNEKTS